VDGILNFLITIPKNNPMSRLPIALLMGLFFPDTILTAAMPRRLPDFAPK
jgi:hypothetical protein